MYLSNVLCYEEFSVSQPGIPLLLEEITERLGARIATVNCAVCACAKQFASEMEDTLQQSLRNQDHNDCYAQ